MSVKILSARVGKHDSVKKTGDLFVQLEYNVLHGSLQLDGGVYAYSFTVNPGFKWDGASNLKAGFLQKVFPCYVEGDPVFNFASKFHDWIYARSGNLYTGVNLTRGECDDCLRGIARESVTMKGRGRRLARLCCGAADLAVGLFAGGGSHWGNDSYGIADKAQFFMWRLG